MSKQAPPCTPSSVTPVAEATPIFDICGAAPREGSISLFRSQEPSAPRHQTFCGRVYEFLYKLLVLFALLIFVAHFLLYTPLLLEVCSKLIKQH